MSSVSTETIDADESVEKIDVETVSLTRNDSDPVQQTSESLLEPVTNKRRNTTEGEGPAAKQAYLTVASVVSSETDAEAVDIICDNVPEFYNICSAHGFELNIHCCGMDDIDIRITQFTPICNTRQVFKEIEKFIDSKRKEPDDEPETQQDNEVARRLAEYKERIRQLEAEFREQDNSGLEHCVKPEIHEEKPSQRENPTETKPSQKESSTSEEEKEKEEFFKHATLDGLKDNEDIVRDICEKLSIDVKGTPWNPFYRTRNMWEKKQAFSKFLNLFQSPSTGTPSPTHEKMFDQFNEIANSFLFKPSLAMLEKEAQRFYDKQKCHRNVVGTAHVLPFKTDTGHKNYFCFAIIDCKIFCWTVDGRPEKAADKLYLEMYNVQKLDPRFRMLVAKPDPTQNCTCIGPIGDLFAHNGRVITWMQQNFKCLGTSVYGDNYAAIPALYNTAITYFENQ